MLCVAPSWALCAMHRSDCQTPRCLVFVAKLAGQTFVTVITVHSHLYSVSSSHLMSHLVIAWSLTRHKPDQCVCGAADEHLDRAPDRIGVEIPLAGSRVHHAGIKNQFSMRW
jgi:hypothetical protein